MLKRKDLLIMSHLRLNARQRLTKISRRTHIPVTTIYDNIKKYENRFIKKYTSILDFRKIGFNAKSKIAIKTKGSKNEVLDYLLGHPNVNSLYRVTSDYDILAEVVFRELRDVDCFLDVLNRRFKIERSVVLNISEEIKKEAFMIQEEL